MATPTTLPSTFVAGNVLTAAEMNALRGAFRILQVASTVKDDVFSTSSTSVTDITGLSVSITPSDTASKVLVLCQVGHSHATSGGHALKLFRDATEIGSGTGGTNQGFAAIGDGFPSDSIQSSSVLYLDSPASTSALTYKVSIDIDVGGTAYINRRASADYWRVSSQITVMEVSA